MAKASAALNADRPAKDGGEHDWEAHDGMHTLMRAGEIIRNKPLLKRVRKHAAAHSQKMADVSKQAAQLAKTGAISEKALTKLAARAKA